ncbi:P-loop containing nucleoside triphosphate hydrolase protein [Dactylonectria macrodidyma]|uniref:P-loop containing nucleoside triphosphate hydrolase protein n=1 Tax=Dactylonectria macrodidyma TaxID=307937 RepID=A0A9P9IQW7_9HYPO|nr:P-loop containing nucleoside triphosphate hydrolase protein [Dactylonectria macrodidyma]
MLWRSQPYWEFMCARLEFCDDEALIIILGSTGSGKSSFARLATGRDDVIVGHDLISSTQSFQAWRFTHDGINYTVVDCPGFDDTQRPDVDLVLELAEYLEMTFRAQFLVSGIVYLHRIVDVRMTGSAVSQLRYVRKLCGTQSFKKVAFVTTFWDVVHKDMGERREDELRENFWSAEMEHGAIMKRLDRGRTSALEVLSELAGKPPVVLEVQRELVVEEKPFEQTAIGKEFVQKTQEFVESLENKADFMRKKLEQLSDKDQGFAAALTEGLNDIEEQLRIKRAELERLKN